MSESEAHMEGHGGGYAFGEHMIALLSSLFVGGAAWGGLWALIQILFYAEELVMLPMPNTSFEEIKVGIISMPTGDPWNAIYLWVPIAFGLIAAVINYGKVLALPDDSAEA